MSDHLPYEEQLAQQLGNLPLPDENMAWEDMKRRLDEDDDDGIIPIWLRGCGPWALLAIILLGLGWWFIRPDKWGSKKREAGSELTIKQNKNASGSFQTNDTAIGNEKIRKEKKIPGATKVVKDSTGEASSSDPNVNPNQPVVKQNSSEKQRISPGTQKKKAAGGNQTTKKNPPLTQSRAPKKQGDKKKPDISTQPSATGREDKTDIGDTKNNPLVQKKDTTVAGRVQGVATSKTDTAIKKISVDSTAKTDSLKAARANEPKKDSSRSKTISFSAGIGMHQLIPVSGQKLTPYNSAGRTGSLADYIPSLFGRMYKNDKWFLQLEFRYGAPQSTKQFLYAQQSRIDTSGGVQFTTTTSNELRKTFYHQLPLTFNYFVTKDWSVGGGIVWNKFFSAISEETVHRKNNSTQADSLLSKRILSTKDDSTSAFTQSAFSKSYFQAILETHYRWKRFSIGAKYSFGLQPYIKFTLPGGTQQQERNQSLQVFLRYELWKSKPKKLN